MLIRDFGAIKGGGPVLTTRQSLPASVVQQMVQATPTIVLPPQTGPCVGVICPPNYECVGGGCQPTAAQAAAEARAAENEAIAAQAAAARQARAAQAAMLPSTPVAPSTIRLPPSMVQRDPGSAPAIQAAITAQRQSDMPVPGMVRTDVVINSQDVAKIPARVDQPVRYIRSTLAPIDPGPAQQPERQPEVQPPPPEPHQDLLPPTPEAQPSKSGVGLLLALAAGAYFLTR